MLASSHPLLQLKYENKCLAKYGVKLESGTIALPCALRANTGRAFESTTGRPLLRDFRFCQIPSQVASEGDDERDRKHVNLHAQNAYVGFSFSGNSLCAKPVSSKYVSALVVHRENNVQYPCTIELAPDNWLLARFRPQDPGYYQVAASPE